jgi:N-6 DNA Methylase
MGFVTPLQFFGIDLNPFAVELARVTLMIARKIAIDNFGILDQPALPLDSLDQNIVCADALFADWPKADAIIGNPPFLGGNRIRQDLGDTYIERIFERFPEVKSQVDFCSYWFRLAHENLNSRGRSGLVGTNTICQGNTRKAGLDYIVQNSGIIHEAISSQTWSGEAVVHVSITNWCYEKPNQIYLDNQLVDWISSSLSTATDVSAAVRLKANSNYSFEGVKPTGKGFIVTEEQVRRWILNDSENQKVLKLFSTGSNLTRNPGYTPDRWIIDFSDMNIEEVSDYRLPFEHVKNFVKPEREANREAVMREKWWRFKRTNEAMRNALCGLNCYITLPRHSKWTAFTRVPEDWLPGDATNVIASDDYYVLGILSSNTHHLWLSVQSSTLKGDTRYTPRTCFETFPFPQTPTQKQIDAIRATAIELHEYRSTQMEKKGWGITKLYNEYFHEPASQLAKLHAKLDDLTLKAYGFSPTDDLLEVLLALNLELAEKEKRGEAVIGPWAPDNPPGAQP